jgi:hypothetical protein
VNVLARRTHVLLVAALGLAGSLALTGGASASVAPPYTDANVVGSIGLCNQAGQQITSGSVTTTPFAWRAVSTQPAQAPYNNAGRTATLVAYQPQEGLPPGDWSGAQLTSSSRYSNTANPIAAATDGDQSLQDIIEQYKPEWDGFLQLRMYLGTANEQAYTLHYPALNIQVTGGTWQAVGGVPVNCASGTSVSIESILLPSSTPPAAVSPTTTSSTAATASARGSTPHSTDTHSASGKGASAEGLASAAPTTSDTSGKSDLPVVLGVALAVVVLAACALLIRRRRLSTQPGGASSAPRPPTSSSS